MRLQLPVELTLGKRYPARGVCLTSYVTLDSPLMSEPPRGKSEVNDELGAKRELLVQVAPRYRAAIHEQLTVAACRGHHANARRLLSRWRLTRVRHPAGPRCLSWLRTITTGLVA